MVDISLVLLIGLFGVACKVFGWNRLVLIVAFSRSDLLENSIRQSMLMSGGDLAIFLRGPISGTLVALTVGVLLVATLLSFNRQRPKTTGIA